MARRVYIQKMKDMEKEHRREKGIGEDGEPPEGVLEEVISAR
jgi:hypothetical protein